MPLKYKIISDSLSMFKSLYVWFGSDIVSLSTYVHMNCKCIIKISLYDIWWKFSFEQVSADLIELISESKYSYSQSMTFGDVPELLPNKLKRIHCQK